MVPMMTRQSLAIILAYLYCGNVKAQKISVNQIIVGDIVDERYVDFDIGVYDKSDLSAYYVKHVGQLDGYELVSFVKSIPCTPTYCAETLKFFLLRNGIIVDSRTESFQREDSPVIRILHDTFIQYLEPKHHWFENELGLMDYDESKDYFDGLRLVVKNDELLLLKELPASELRIYRNLIFAKYGYVFKSEDLNRIFQETEWYTPIQNLISRIN